MLVKLSGDKYIESTYITAIEPRMGSATSWIVYMLSGENWLLTQQQFDELMDCLPSPVTSKKFSKGAHP